VPFEGCLHDPALHTAATTVNQPHFVEPCLHGRVHILFNNRGDVLWREGVQVDLALYGNPEVAR
jgi:hypothetical protein